MVKKPSSTVQRCHWASKGDTLRAAYHDNEWGTPVHDDRKHFEFLILEGAQAGLSWITILKRREGYRKAFGNFDPKVVARFDEAKVLELMQDKGIIRNKLKIRSCIKNAKLFLDIQKEFGSFDKYVWRFVGGAPIQNHRKSPEEVPAETAESQALSKDLKKRGFTFVGPSIMYAFMQTTGLVNDHLTHCYRYKKAEKTKPVKGKWKVYIIRTESDMLYTGITTDLNRRFSEHKSHKKGAKFFHLSNPGEIVFQESHPDRSSATQREIAIKKMSRKQKLQLILTFQTKD